MDDTFTAIDFETAQGYRWSICQVGVVRVENGIITKEIDLLVQPPNNYYWKRFTDIHGISASDTSHAPTFDQVWQQIAPYIENQNVVAHNGFGFDFPVLSKTLEYYGLSTPDYNKFCTYRLYGTNLASLCREHDIPLNHHDALSDVRACGELFLRRRNITNRTYGRKHQEPVTKCSGDSEKV
jgi:DNA polymerase-3 subunit epsilon